jgi:hypothetical protein
MSALLIWLKGRLARVTVVAEFCKDCGARQPLVWHAEDALWAAVSGDRGVLCPKCFGRRARDLGLLLMWRPVIYALRDADGMWVTA